MEKKLTNSGPLREPADKHSIYTLELWAALLEPLRMKYLLSFRDQ